MNKKCYKKQLKKMDYRALILESFSLGESIRDLDDLKEKAQKDNDISSLCNIMNKRAEYYEKLWIASGEIKMRQKEE